MADDNGIGRGFFHGGKQVLGSAHKAQFGLFQQGTADSRDKVTATPALAFVVQVV